MGRSRVSFVLTVAASCSVLMGYAQTPTPFPRAGTPGGRRILTGWGGGKADDVVPKAAAVGFRELVVHHENAGNFARFIELGKQHEIDIYAWLYLGDLPAWKKAFPEHPPPVQVMNSEENAALERIKADQSVGKSQYQFGGEPVGITEVLLTPLLCFHDPRVLEAFKKQIGEMLSVPGVKGVAFDYIGYQNYRCCRCTQSQNRLATYRRQHVELTEEQSLARFSLETLVAFNNLLSAHARTVKPDAKVITHVYPVYLPEPLYGNRLDLDVCGQTAAWFFAPFWSLDKIREYARTISGEGKRYHRRPDGAALIGYYNSPEKYPVKSRERLTAELQAILDGGCPRVHVCSFNHVLKSSVAEEVFRAFFGRSAER
ncbi:MAG: hypothetical protein HON70_09560 [Lentisphaerae bacterium]|nr:hypothetical protein [Lentisphaerota bacterium]